MLQKTPFKTNRTFIGLGTEHKEEYDRLVATNNKHIMFTDKSYIPDMKPITSTHTLYQLDTEQHPTTSGKWKLHISDLPCSYPLCRKYEGVHSCMYTDDRNIKNIDVSEKTNGINTEKYSFSVSTLTVAELKHELCQRALSRSGNKPILHAQLLECMQEQASADNYNQDKE